METQEQIERIEHFIREVVVDEITKLQGVGLSYMQFVIMGQAIEVLGSFLDNKPMKAKGQSAKRISLPPEKNVWPTALWLSWVYYLKNFPEPQSLAP